MNETREEMVCDELVELVTGYIEGTLPDSDRIRLEEHLTECSWCEEYVAQHREIISALRHLDDRDRSRDGAAFAGLLELLSDRSSER